jgi:uncharacterized protein
MKRVACFYHSADLDGKCSAAIVGYYFAKDRVDFFPIDYKDKFPYEKIGMILYTSPLQFKSTNYDIIVMVDFSLPRKDMLLINNGCKENDTKFIWIDHHKSAIEKCAGLEHIKGIREIGKAGCELTWEYFFKSELPTSVMLLGRYDVWDHKDPRVLPFQYGMRLEDVEVEDYSYWHSLFYEDRHLGDIIERGVTVFKYQTQQDTGYAKGFCFEALFEGLRAICCNKGAVNSTMFKSVYDPLKHDIMIAFVLTPSGKWKYQLFSDKDNVDCAKLAEKYGGGGHKGAAGFFSENQIWISLKVI